MSLSRKYCECGCGRRVSLAKKTQTRLGHVKGQPVRFVSGHHSNKSKPFLTPAQIRAAHTLYLSGLSSVAIASLIWEKNGYASAEACATALTTLFRQRRMARRSFSEANLLRHANRGCSGCGCGMDERTYNCRNCAARHSRRRKRGVAAPTVFPDNCRRCGVHLDLCSPGCRSCVQRHRQRAANGWTSRAKTGPAPRTENCEPSSPGGAAPFHKPRRPLPVGTSADASDPKEASA